jgi:hypothetical protein
MHSPDSPPRLQLSIAWLQTGVLHRQQKLPGELMSFLQQSDLKKHLSTRSGNISPRHNEAIPAEGSRVILRDGNLITLPPPIPGEDAVETARIDRADT